MLTGHPPRPVFPWSVGCQRKEWDRQRKLPGGHLATVREGGTGGFCLMLMY